MSELRPPPATNRSVPGRDPEPEVAPTPTPPPDRRMLDPIRLLGQTLVTLGLLTLLFAAFQLWGTGLLEWRAQQQLDDEFETMLADFDAQRAQVTATPQEAVPAPDEPVANADDPVVAAPPTPVEEVPAPESEERQPNRDLIPVVAGNALARLEIPSIGVSKTVVNGVDRDTLRQGPGHYPTTALPGHPGNTALAGHRTTHGSPFFDLDKVQPGDQITVQTVEGLFTYEVEAHDGPNGARGYFIVDPSDVSVIADQGDNRLTLTACHPKFSARQRIVVTATLVGEPLQSDAIALAPLPVPDPVVVELPAKDPAEAVQAEGAGAVPGSAAGPLDSSEVGEPATGDVPPVDPAAVDPAAVDPGATVGELDNQLEESLGWQMHELDSTIMWATITLLLAHAGWILGRLWRRRPAYLLSVPVVAPALFVCFVHLDRLLPAF